MWNLHVKISMMNDAHNLYIKAKIDGLSDTPWESSWVEFRFDGNHNAQIDKGSDDKLVFSSTSGFEDADLQNGGAI